MTTLEGVQVLMFVGDGYEDLELHYPRLRLLEAGADVVVAGPEENAVYRGKHGYPCRADVALIDVVTDDFAGLVIPGGLMPDKMRMDGRALRITQQMAADSRVIGAICHAAQILISAGLADGRRMTCYRSVRDDLVNAGADYRDEPVVVDPPFVTSRTPDDLPPFCRALVQALKELGARTEAAAR